MPPPLLQFVGLPLALLVAAAIATSAWLVARALMRGAAPGLVLCAAIVLAHAMLVGWFEVLGAVRTFEVAPAVAAPVAAAALAVLIFGRRDAFGDLLALAQPARHAFAGLLASRVAVVGAALLAALALAKALRAVVAPGLATDTLLYHTPRAAAWVHAGGWVSFGAPDIWTIYDFFPPGGDVPWAWCILLARSEALIGATSVLVWAEALVGLWATGRALGMAHARAAAIALVVCSTPAAATYAGTAYVDNQVLASFALGSALLAGAVVRPRLGTAALAAVAFSLAAGVKSSALVLLPLAFVAGTWGARSRLCGARAALRWTVGWALGSLLVWPHLIRAWMATGSPLHPFGLQLGSLQVFPSNETWELIGSGRMYLDVQENLPAFLRMIFGVRLDGQADQTGFGPAALVLIVLSTLGLSQRHRGRGWMLAFLLGVALVFFAGVAGPSALAYRTGAAMHTARYLLAGFAAVALLAGMTRGRWIDAALATCLGANLLMAVPLGWGKVDVIAVGTIAPAALAALALSLATLWTARRRALLVATAVVLATLTWGWATIVRADHRADYLAGLEARTLYDIHPPGRIAPGARRAWQLLDEAPASRIAVTAGWNGEGMHWYLSPLLAGDLRHELVYVPPSRDGSAPSYRKRDELLARSSYRAWRERLLEENIQYVAALAPPGLERAWMDRHPQHFAPVAASDSRRYALFRVLVDTDL